MNEWQKTKLGDFFPIKTGKRDANFAVKSGKYPFFTCSKEILSCDEYSFDGDAVLLAGNGEFNVKKYSGKFDAYQRTYVLIPYNNQDRDYLYYLVKQYLTLITKGSRGSIVKFITKGMIEDFTFLSPCDAERHRIASVLSALDAKIELNNKINSELELVAKILYGYWFMQFDFPDANGNPYKSSGGAMVYNVELKREVPAGWTVKSVSDLLSVKTGKQDANFATQNGKYAYFTCGKPILRCDTAVYKGKSVLIAGNGTFDVKYYSGAFNAYQRVYVLTPKDEQYIGVIYRNALDSIGQFTRGSNGSIVKFITKGDVEGIKIIVPEDMDLLKPFNTVLDIIEKNNEESARLKHLRDWLLPMLMNGQVVVE